MDLWIRSQNRKEMTKPNYIRIIERTNHCLNRDEYIIQDEEYCDLGTYKSEERALEVLDEIEHKICVNIGYVLATNSGISPDSINNVDYCGVYEMPLE